MSEQHLKLSKKILKSQELNKTSPSSREHPSRKHHRKGGNPLRIPPPTNQGVNFKCPQSWICRNSACLASISMDEKFCKSCSCCICHLFDDNKDPSLWLECIPVPGEGESCGLTCHIECALKQGKVGVVDLGQLMQLDGSYCCAFCGNVSEILGIWKQQLSIAKDAHRADILCFRIYLSYRLLDGTSRFHELHNIVKEAKTILEKEVGPLNGISSMMARGVVSRLTVSGAVQSLCSLAIAKADDWLAKKHSSVPNYKEGSMLAACKFFFEEVTVSSVVIVLLDLLTASSVDVRGHKLWYCRAGVDTYRKDPNCVIPKSQKSILISNLHSSTEYCFRIVSYTESGDLGHTEANCFTKSVEISHSNLSSVAGNHSEENTVEEDHSNPSSCQLDLNVAIIPDLNEELSQLITPASSRDQPTADLVEDAVSKDNDGNCISRQEWAHPGESRKRAGSTNCEAHDSDSVLVSSGSPIRVPNNSSSGLLDENFEHCVKTVRWLECEGHVNNEFRLKFLSWFSLRSTERERRVVNTYIQTLIDDPSSLAGQLVHSFSEIISSKRAKGDFCSRLWQ
ncbi:hypothetical protein DM860_005423 [Cuscuta australis]|uniref:Fibronectin type-III domain-containing protein n=1 Tax=Cuscuta australis TaxID=267555 RepID=A0A328DZF7_9ASTE|nr:hypothetical protein DM860_005423 [Cuscuta australis]